MSLALPVIQLLLVWLPAFYLAHRLLPLHGPGRYAFCLGASGIGALVFSGAVLWLGLVISGQELAWLPVVVLAVAALLSVWLGPRPGATARAPSAQAGVGARSGRAGRVVIVILSALISVRVLSLLPDVILRPLFAWDAWTVWGHEARVWLEVGGFVDFAAPGEWLSAPAEVFLRDTLIDYPKLLPALILWTVPAGAAWTGVGPGVLWLAVAACTALVIFGAVRAAGAGPAWALGAAYVYLSLPLVNAHVALYGYADLWLAALLAVFAGLLVLAERDGRKRWLVLAVGVLATLPLVKVEGSYWILCGLTAVLAARFGIGVRVLVVLCIGGTAGVLLAAAFGLDPLALATAGRLKIVPDGMDSALAGAARHAFVWFDWHLLVYLVLAVVALLMLRPALAARLRGLVALCLFGLVMLWGFTPLTGAGEFLSVGTLFSRIFLQFSPATIILGALVAHRVSKADAHDSRGEVLPPPARAGAALVLAGLLLWIGWTAWGLTESGARQVLPARVVEPTAESWRMAEGEGELTEQGFRVTASGRRGRARLAVELPPGLRAEDFDRVELRFGQAVPGQLAFGWSRTESFQPVGWLVLDADRDTSASVRLGAERQWRDPVYFLAVEQLGFTDGAWTVEAIVLHPARPGFGRLQRVLLDSVRLEMPWTQRNPHFLWPLDPVTRVSPVLAVALWIALVGLLSWPIRPRDRAWTIAWLGLPIALGWLVLDLRWQVELGHKAHATVAAFAGQPPAERFARDIDGELFEFARDLRLAHPRSDFDRVFAFSEVEFWRKRARYHLAAWDVRPAAADRLNAALVEQFRPGDLLLLPRMSRFRLVPVEGAADKNLVELRDEKDQALALGERILHRSDWTAFRVR